jgi:PAS domain-containing protein
VISSGESLRVPNCDDTFAKSAAINLDHVEYLRKELRCRSLLTVPIGASDEVLGALTFIRDTLATPFDDFDRIAGEELAARLGLALRYTSIRERLAEERARLDAIVARVPVGVLVADQDGKILLGNSELDRVFGRSLKCSDAITEYAMHADGRPLRADEYPMARAIHTRETTRGEELLYQRGDGHLRAILDFCTSAQQSASIA